MRGLITSTVPQLQDKIRDTIDPHFVAAAGAAYWAELQALDPELLGGPTSCPHLDDGIERDEL